MSLVVLFFREDKLVERAKALKVNAGTEPVADLGPVISKQVFRNFAPLSVFAISILAVSLSTIH